MRTSVQKNQLKQILKCLKCMSAHGITQRQNIFFEFSYFHSLFVDLIVDYTRFELVNENQQGYVWGF